MAGPWASQILADLGADVIKVERPGAGDDTRTWGPPFLKDAQGGETRESGYYLSVNRSKRSIALELDKPEGQAIVRKLAERSDIVLENFKVGTLTKYGLGYEALKAINPRLVYASITGFGQTGPRKDNAAYDFMIQAMGGLMSVTGESDSAPGGKPQKVGVPITDIMTGMYSAIAVLAAIARRNESGEGEYIDIGMLDVQASYLANQAMNYLVSGKTPQRTGNAHPNIQPQDVFRTADGYIVLVVGNDGQFEKFCGVTRHARACAGRTLRAQCGPRAQSRRTQRHHHAEAHDKGPAALACRLRGGGRAGRADQHHPDGVRGRAGAPSRHAGPGRASHRRASAACGEPDEIHSQSARRSQGAAVARPAR